MTDSIESSISMREQSASPTPKGMGADQLLIAMAHPGLSKITLGDLSKILELATQRSPGLADRVNPHDQFAIISSVVEVLDRFVQPSNTELVCRDITAAARNVTAAAEIAVRTTERLNRSFNGSTAANRLCEGDGEEALSSNASARKKRKGKKKPAAAKTQQTTSENDGVVSPEQSGALAPTASTPRRQPLESRLFARLRQNLLQLRKDLSKGSETEAQALVSDQDLESVKTVVEDETLLSTEEIQIFIERKQSLLDLPWFYVFLNEVVLTKMSVWSTVVDHLEEGDPRKLGVNFLTSWFTITVCSEWLAEVREKYSRRSLPYLPLPVMQNLQVDFVALSRDQFETANGRVQITQRAAHDCFKSKLMPAVFEELSVKYPETHQKAKNATAIGAEVKNKTNATDFMSGVLRFSVDSRTNRFVLLVKITRITLTCTKAGKCDGRVIFKVADPDSRESIIDKANCLFVIATTAKQPSQPATLSEPVPSTSTAAVTFASTVKSSNEKAASGEKAQPSPKPVPKKLVSADAKVTPKADGGKSSVAVKGAAAKPKPKPESRKTAGNPGTSKGSTKGKGSGAVRSVSVAGEKISLKEAIKLAKLLDNFAPVDSRKKRSHPATTSGQQKGKT